MAVELPVEVAISNVISSAPNGVVRYGELIDKLRGLGYRNIGMSALQMVWNGVFKGVTEVEDGRGVLYISRREGN
jgi:hypothetical protein